MCRENIETDRELFIRGIEDNYVLRSMTRNASQNILYEITVRVDHCEPVPVLNVLFGHGEQQSALAGTARPYAIGMSKAILNCETNNALLALVLVQTKDDSIRSCGFGSTLSLELTRFRGHFTL